METINHECYVSFGVAKLLKEAGFNWGCRGYFDGIEFHPNGSVECTNYNSNTCKYLKAPTLDVAQRWLREMKGIHVYVISYRQNNQDKISGYCYKVYEFTQGWEFNCFSYEEAQEAGIKRALEIILEKEE